MSIKLIPLAILLILISCGGGPPPEEDKPAPDSGAKSTTQNPTDKPAPSKESLDALNSARDRAETNRKKALDVQGQEYFPNEWKSAESKNAAGNNAKKDTDDAVKAATALYTEAGDEYESIAENSGPLLAKDREEALKTLQEASARAEQSQKTAQDAQAPVYFPNDWKAAETTHQNGKDAKRDTLEEIKAATALYTQAADAYDAIAGKSQAQLAKDKAEADKALQAAMARAAKSRQTAQDAQAPVYFPNDWKNAEAKNQAGQSAKKTTPDEIKAATALYTQAADAYDAIAGKSQAQLAKDKAEADKALQAAMARAAKSRQTAQDAQAPVYFPNDWKNAEAKNQAGQSAKKTTPDEIKAATALYTQAADAYDDLAGKSRTQLAQDRENADKALQAAMARAEQSRKNAQEAQAPVYFPNDWKNAEAKNQAGQSAKKTTPDEIKAATALYTQAADAYDSMTAKTQSQLAKDREEADKALQAAMARAEQSRKNAQDAQAPVYFPNDWKNAEAKNQAGQSAKKTTPDEIKAAAALYTQAADAYDDLAGKSRTQLAKDRENADKALEAAMARAEQSRKNAQEAQAPVYFPNDWKNAEAKNQAGQNAKKSTPEEIKAATALYTQAADAYDSMTAKTQSQLAKDKADADKALQAAMARAEQSRKNAQEAQAPVNYPADWKNAETTRQNGQNAKKDTTDEIKAATALYTQAADAYDSMTAKTQSQLAKEREEADKALQAAMARAEQSRKNAQEAQAPVYFPNDWKNAETKNQAGQSAKKTTPDEIKAAAALYTQAADAYDDLAGKSQSQLAKDREEAEKALQTAIARAEQSRNQAMGYQGPSYFPNDWKNAEAKNQAGQSAKKTTPDEIKAATALYTQAADTYDDIAGKSRPQYLESWEAQVAKERGAAIDAGITEAGADHLAAADRLAEETRRNLRSNTYIPNESETNLPIDMYRSLKPRAEGYKVRQEIVRQGLENTDRANLAAGDADTQVAIQEYESRRAQKSLEMANSALDKYNAVLKSGHLALAQTRMNEAGRERQIAIDAKAPVAVKDDFDIAETAYQQAVNDFNNGKYEAAAAGYSQSALQFLAAAEAAEKKRRLAEEAIAAAKRKTAESTAFATNTGLAMEENNE